MPRSPYFWAGLLLFALLYFAITAYDLPVVTVLCAAALGVLSVVGLGLVRIADETSSRSWEAVVMAAAAAVLGTILKAVAGSLGMGWDLLGIVVAATSAWGFEALRTWSRPSNCFLCRNPVASGQSFTCPRCGQAICALTSCWSGRHSRCTSCLQREVILFPTRDDWWEEQLGARVPHGACDACYKEAHETDLRACGQCTGMMCRRCWDYHNGTCGRCGWHIRELPPALWPFIAAERNVAGRSVRRGRHEHRGGREARRPYR